MDTPNQSSTKAAPLAHRECVGEAAVSMLGSACGLELCACEDDGELASDGVLIGVISLIGGVEWSLFLGLPRATAVALARQFAGFDIPFDSDDMGDAAGELTNILAGEVKRLLAQRGVEATISLPSVLRAQSLHVLVQRGMAVTKTCFDSAAGKLWTGVISTREGGFVA